MASEDKKLWTEQEDSILVSLVKIYGTKKWAHISRELKEKHDIKDKTGKQCRERWNNSLNPKLIDEPWSAQEEKILFEMQEKYGNKWSIIARNLKGRSDNATKNHFYSIIRKNLRRCNKSKPDDQKIAGNIQDLLEKEEYRKILLKKPRHYYKRPDKKPKIEIKPPDSPALKCERRRSKIIEKAPFDKNSKENSFSARKASNTLKLPDFQDNERPNDIVYPTPVHPFIDEIPGTPLYNLLSSYSTRNSFKGNELLTCQGLNGFDFSPSQYNKRFNFSRDPNRTSSMKSSEDGFSGRGDSRKSTDKSEFLRSDSRKNTDKSEFARCDSRKNTDLAEFEKGETRTKTEKEIFERNDSRKGTYYNMAFPMYSPKVSFDFNKTPRNLRSRVDEF